MAINGEKVNDTKIHFFEIRLMQYNEIIYDTKYLMLLITWFELLNLLSIYSS